MNPLIAAASVIAAGLAVGLAPLMKFTKGGKSPFWIFLKVF